MSRQVHVLYADADAHFRHYVTASLGQAGIRSTAVDNAAALMAEVDQAPASLLVIDEQLPDASGTALCAQVRSRSALPIVLTTHNGSVEQLVRALELGADDALVKPFDPRLLAARIRAVLRRAQPQHAPQRIDLGRWTLDLAERQLVSATGEQRTLTPCEFRLLQVLAQHANQPLDRDQLALAVRRVALDPLDRYIDNLVVKLRRKLDDSATSPRLIKTFRGEGYMLSLPTA